MMMRSSRAERSQCKEPVCPLRAAAKSRLSVSTALPKNPTESTAAGDCSTQLTEGDNCGGRIMEKLQLQSG